ncbi:MAG: aspartate kinase, partial [Chloroflexi bacterium]|nr:aspartate kinase [Chloroflexota bacterium]
MRIVMKFGGTSVGDGARIKNAAELARASATQGHAVVVAVSAMSGVTDTLIRAAKRAAEGDGETFVAAERDLWTKHLAALEQAVADAEARAALREQVRRGLDGFVDFCTSIQILGELTPRALDAIASLGERLCAPIFAQTLRESGANAEAIQATELIVTDDRFTQASPLMDATCEKTRARLLPLLQAGAIPVVTGFIGATKNGVMTTLGRGGSDYTGTILGAALDADEVWIWTDVDGVMTADPRVVKDARSLDVLTYREVAELAFYGAKVLHPKTIRPVVESGGVLRIKNTFNPSHPGTRIVEDGNGTRGAIKAVTAIKSLNLITVEGRGMMGVPGVAAR